MQVVRVQSIVICKCHSLKGDRGESSNGLERSFENSILFAAKNRGVQLSTWGLHHVGGLAFLHSFQ